MSIQNFKKTSSNVDLKLHRFGITIVNLNRESFYDFCENKNAAISIYCELLFDYWH